jgi:AraC-like DNA-binding protein
VRGRADVNQAQGWGAMSRVSSLLPVVQELDRRNRDVGSLLTQHLMTRDQLANPYSEIPLARYIAFLESCATVAASETFGAEVGTSFRSVNLGPVGLLVGASATLRRGLECLVRTLAIWQDGTSIGLHSEDKTLVWTYRIEDPLIWPRRQDSEFTLAATIAIAREAFGASGRPLEAHLENAPPADPDVLTRLLGVRPFYGQPSNRLIFDLKEADRPHRREDPEMMAMLGRHLDDLHHRSNKDGLLGQVRALIGLHLGHRTISVPMVARELGVSSRTLQRRLADDGTSLRSLVQRVRIDLGRAHLREGRASTAEIARTLGYTDATAFWRAFKADMGIAPSLYRRSGDWDGSHEVRT